MLDKSKLDFVNNRNRKSVFDICSQIKENDIYYLNSSFIPNPQSRRKMASAYFWKEENENLSKATISVFEPVMSSHNQIREQQHIFGREQQHVMS